MRRTINALALAVVLAVSLVGLQSAVKPAPAEATLFGCAPQGVADGGRYDMYIVVCAEHGAGWYRSNALAKVWDQQTSQFVASNFGFYDMNLYYYCYDGNGCNLYDSVDREGYIGVLQANPVGDNIGCPGASNQGEVTMLRVAWRPPDNVLRETYITTNQEPDHVPFNSSC